MPSLWGRFKGWVNDRISEQPSAPSFPSEPPPTPPIIGGLGEDEEGLPWGEEEGRPLDVYDEFGDYWGTETWEQWYRDTLLNKEAFQAKYGLSYSNIDLIYALEDTLGIDWDWATWREDYDAANS